MLPRTWLGWKRLFWITLRRCVRCHGPVCRDFPQYDDGTAWCLPCDGAPQPHGFWHALWWNKQAVLRERGTS
jgi:hypothetical protein